MQDASDPERIVEPWHEASWTQPLRRHARVTAAEKALQERILNLLAPGAASEIYHLVTPEPGATPKTPGQETKT